MDTFNRSQQKTPKIEDFLDTLEGEEGDAAYAEYLAGSDSGKSLEELKAELG